MKHNLIIFLFLIGSASLVAQNQPSSYKLSKIILKTGEIINVKNIKVDDENVSYNKYNSTAGKAINYTHKLETVESITIPTKKGTVPGTIIGGGIGVISMLIIEKKVEEPKSTTIHYPDGGYLTTTTYYTMSGIQKIGIITIGAGVGALLGTLVKTGWKSIYPNETSNLNNLDIDFDFNFDANYSPTVHLCYKF